MNIEEVLEDIKRHLDYVNATKQKSIRDTEIEVMYKEIERLNNIIKEVREWILFQQEHSMEPYIATDMLDDILEILNKGE